MKNDKTKILLGLLLLGGVLLFEVANLGAVSLWHDEAFSGLLPQYNFKEMIHRIGLDVHPPLYYIFLKLWLFTFGNTPFTLRLFSLLFGVITLLVTYIFANEVVKNKKIAFLSVVLMGLNLYQIQYNLEARMYTLGAFFIVLSSYALLKAERTNSIKWWGIYVFCTASALYTHYYTFFFVFAQAFYLSFGFLKKLKFSLRLWLKNKKFQRCTISFLSIGLLFLPWLKTFLKQAAQVEKSYWIPKINIWSLPCTFYKMISGRDINPNNHWYILIVLTIFILASAIYFVLKIKKPAKWLVISLLFIPFLLAVLSSIKTSIYLDRYFIFSLPFLLIVVSATLLNVKYKKIQTCLILIAVLASALNIPLRWHELNIANKPGMKEAAEYINNNAKNEKIYVGSSFVYFTFLYYNKTLIRPKLYAPGTLSHFSGTALLSSGDVIKNLEKQVKKKDIIWMINTTGFGNFQPQIPKNWHKIEEKWFRDLYDYRGWIIISKYRVD